MAVSGKLEIKYNFNYYKYYFRLVGCQNLVPEVQGRNFRGDGNSDILSGKNNKNVKNMQRQIRFKFKYKLSLKKYNLTYTG